MQIGGAFAAVLICLLTWRFSRFVRHNLLPRYSDRKALLPHKAPGDAHSLHLGLYYADFRRCLSDATNDEAGVAAFAVNTGIVYNPCAVAQAAIIAYEDFTLFGRPSSRERLRVQLEWLSGHAATTNVGACFFYRYDTATEVAPWGSGIAQGIAISALLRGYQALGQLSYLDLARRAFLQMDAAIDEGGFRHEDAELPLWYEEDNHRGHIVNGHIFALLGVHDLYRVTGDPVFRHRFEAGVDSLFASLPRFDLGFHTAYQLDDPMPANNCYHLIHVTLFEVLAGITMEARWQTAADRFRRYHNELRFRARTAARLLAGAVRR